MRVTFQASPPSYRPAMQAVPQPVIAPRFGQGESGDRITSKGFLKTGALYALGNAVWLSVLLGAAAIGVLPTGKDKHPHQEPPAIVQEAPRGHDHAHGPHEDPDHAHEAEEDHAHGPAAPPPRTVQGEDHGVHDVDENFFQALLEHMPLETANDLIRELAQMGILYGLLRSREAMRSKKAKAGDKLDTHA